MANSSGAAANHNRESAIQHAVLELIERDSFMIAWLNRLRLPRVRNTSLPQWAIHRIAALERERFRVSIVDLTLDLAPVILVFAQNHDLPMTTCSACSDFDKSAALEHALEEVEAAAYCRLRNPVGQHINPHEVRRTYHHGDLYGNRRFYLRADFLAQGKACVSFRDAGRHSPKCWGDLSTLLLTKGLSVVTIDLHPHQHLTGGHDPAIVKVFIPGIIPMSFGYGLEPCGMKRIYTLPVHLGFRATSLKYSELEKFPHPYT